MENMSSESPIGEIYLHLSAPIPWNEDCKTSIWIHLHSMLFRQDLLSTFENGENLDNSYLLNK